MEEFVALSTKLEIQNAQENYAENIQTFDEDEDTWEDNLLYTPFDSIVSHIQ